MPPINFKFPLRNGDLGYFDTNDDTRSAVKENIKLTILTNIGERVISDVGSSVHINVFDTNHKDDMEMIIKSKLDDMFKKFFQDLKLGQVIIKTSLEDITIPDTQIIVNFTYSFKNVEGISDSLTIALE